ncbi:3170_t:CDS:1, partial [Cetraspora pellucida]
LKGITAMFVAIMLLKNLNEAMIAARKVEVSDYYSTYTFITMFFVDKKDKLIKDLVKQVQQLS